MLVGAEEATDRAGVASWTSGVHTDQKRVAVTINTDIDDFLGVPAGCALVPKFLPAAAPEDRLAKGQGTSQTLGIHPRHHQDLMAVGILHNGRH